MRSDEAKRYRRWYFTNRWRKLRQMCLDREPICRMCKNAPSTVADHRVPHRGDERLFWDFRNLQGLCKHCHDSHKHREEARGYSGDVDASGWPVDPMHPVNR